MSWMLMFRVQDVSDFEAQSLAFCACSPSSSGSLLTPLCVGRLISVTPQGCHPALPLLLSVDVTVKPSFLPCTLAAS